MRQRHATHARIAGTASGAWTASRAPGATTPPAVSLDIAPTVHAARIARLAVTRALVGDAADTLQRLHPLPAAVVDTVVLLTDELVTNAAVHAGTICRLDVVVGGDAVTVSVFDASHVIPAPRKELALESPRADEVDIAVLALGGRGLRLVELLATTWGVEPLSEGKRVWFSASLHRGGD